MFPPNAVSANLDCREINHEIELFVAAIPLGGSNVSIYSLIWYLMAVTKTCLGIVEVSWITALQ